MSRGAGVNPIKSHMSLHPPLPEESVELSPPQKAKVPFDALLMWLLILTGFGMLTAVFLPPESPYTLSYALWYADFRYWSPWVSGCCWLIFAWAVCSFCLHLFIPENTERPLIKRRSFYQRVTAVLFIFFLWAVWYNHSTLPLATLFSPLLSPVTNYIYTHYTIPLSDYYTTGEGRSPAFLPVLLVLFLALSFVAWRVWHHVKQWKASKTVMTTAVLMGVLPMILGADADAPAPPPKVETFIGIYDVQSKEDIHQFTAEEIRELVKMEDDRTRGSGLQPHPVLVYCFEERSFHYTGGKYDNAEIRYRLRVPQKIVRGRKYPLIVHLHGIGEAGNDNRHSLAHLHSILPLLIGPEQQDFFLLVLQCPRDERHWTFKPTKDGNLDVVAALTDHVIQNNPIDERRLSTFGLSSGGAGVWAWIARNPEKFAAAAPAATTFPGNYRVIPELNQTPVWVFVNKGDAGVAIPPLLEAKRHFEASNGYMRLTQLDQGGHASWRPALDEYNCFSWMIAQKRGGWFNPPPERKIYQSRSLVSSFFAFFLPLGLAAGLIVFQRSLYCEIFHQKITEKLYHSQQEDAGEEEESKIDDTEPTLTETFRVWMDVTGTKKIKAKVLDFQDDGRVRIQSPDGKIATALIKQFCVADQKLMREIRNQKLPAEGFRKWTDKTGKHTFTAKFLNFQPDGKVVLQSDAGKTVSVPIERLGQEEQEFLKQQKNESQLPT